MSVSSERTPNTTELTQKPFEAAHALRPIHTDADYEAALGEVETLFAAAPGTREADRLEVLATLIEAYESRHHPVLPPDPIDAIVYHMESRGLSRQDLEPFVGSRATVADVLNRRRPLTLAMVRRLHDGLGLPADVLIRPYPLESTGRTHGPQQAPMLPHDSQRRRA
jgi:HTH-type transcriptional regulator / antitoxin HigA